MSKMSVWFKNLSRVGKVSLISAVALGGLFVASATSAPQPPVTPTPATVQTEVKKPVITTEVETKTEAIPFDKTTVNDATTLTGTSYVKTSGVNGVKTITYTITLTDGVETGRTSTEAITTAPVTEVTALGTKAPAPVCPNGTYVNSAGNTVCSPYSAPSTPSGATAKCRDGSYSFSQSRSGTCSHHGGVSTWL